MLNESEQKKRLEHGVWLDEVERAFRAWRAAPNSEKSQLLLTGMTLTWAENWRLTNPGDFSPATHTFIARSVATQSTKVSTERQAADAETRRRDKVYQQILLLMALFAIVILGPNAIRQTFLQQPAQSAALGQVPPAAQVAATAVTTTRVTRPTVIVDDPTPLLRSPAALAAEAGLAARQAKLPLARRLALEAVFAAPAGAAPAEALSLIADHGRERTASRWDQTSITGAEVLRGCDGGRLLARSAGQWLVLDPAASSLKPLAPATRPLDIKALGSDCRRALTTNDDYDVTLESLVDTTARRKFGSHETTVVAMRFSGNGNRAVSVSRDGVGRIWDTATGRAIARFKTAASTFNGAAFDDAGRRIVTWSDDATAEFWDAATGVRQGQLAGHQSPVVTAMFTPDGSQLLTVSSDGTAKVWSAATRELVNAFNPAGAIVDAWLSADGRRVVARLDENGLQVWDIETGRASPIIPTTDGTEIFGLSGDGLWLALADRKGKVSVWDTSSGARRLALNAGAPVLVLQFNDGALRAIGGAETTTWPLPMTRDRAVDVAKGTELCIEAPVSPWCAKATGVKVGRVDDSEPPVVNAQQ